MTDIHQTAIVDENAKIGKNVFIGPYSAIGPEVERHAGLRPRAPGQQTVAQHKVLDRGAQ